MKKRYDWFLAVVVIVFAIVSAIVIGVAIDDMESREISRLTGGASVDSLRSVHQELNLRTLEDSVSYYEDGF